MIKVYIQYAAEMQEFWVEYLSKQFWEEEQQALKMLLLCAKRTSYRQAVLN